MKVKTRNLQEIFNIALAAPESQARHYMCNQLAAIYKTGSITESEYRKAIRATANFMETLAKKSGDLVKYKTAPETPAIKVPAGSLNSALHMYIIINRPELDPSALDIQWLKLDIFADWANRYKILAAVKTGDKYHVQKTQQ